MSVLPGDRLAGASFLITGGTGSFGAAMARRLLATGCEQVRIFSRDEAKQEWMRRSLGDGRLRVHLGDVRDLTAVRRACQGVDYVFHAAALKQVPSCEFFPHEAVRTNVDGSAHVVEAARAAGVRTVVCLSTDKAVYPINAMGMSKALMEKVAQAASRDRRPDDPVVCTVRYGNVLCTRGSIVPLFVEQARSRVPFTVTDPAMTRFLLSLDEAVELVEHAFTAAAPGDTFVRKAPACTVETLARAVARLWDVPAKLEIIGVRHGEKLHETLLARHEAVRAQVQGQYLRIPLDVRGLDYHRYVDEGGPRPGEVPEYDSRHAHHPHEDEVVRMLYALPEVRAELPEQPAPVLP